jgi:hypothetical protein
MAEVRSNDGKPVPGVAVEFDLVAPEPHFLGLAVTDSLGVVSFPVTATKKARPHTVVAMDHQKLFRKTTSPNGNCPARWRADSSALPTVTAMMMS